MVRQAYRDPQVFLLSPAFCGGRRAAILQRQDSTLPLARAFRDGTLTLGEAFSFLSGLYFRGKFSYARAFARAPDELGPILIVTPTRGLQQPEMRFTPDIMGEFASVDVSATDARYRRPMERDVQALAARLPATTRVVLLGSVASNKYVDILMSILGPRLFYPPSFIGRGDMSRGGLMLRSVAAGVELDYAVLDSTAIRHGPRPPKLVPLR
ncbi:MAG: hypothetical protein ACRD2A_01800 [Vicinamibacterales bacterium]